MSGLLAGLFEKRALKSPSFKVSQTPPAYVDRWGGAETPSGVNVDEDTAMQLSAVFSCVRILSETIAYLPLILYRRLSDGGKERASDHPLYPILHDLPNSEMTSYDLRQILIGHQVLRGNCFAEIERSNGGQVLNLWPMRPDRFEDIRREDGTLMYYYRLPAAVGGQVVALDQSRILHVRGLGTNGIVGYSPIAIARNAIGLGMATEEFGGRFFSNGARPGGVLEHPSALSDKAYQRLKDSWENRHQGLSNAERTAILEEGTKYHEIGVAPDEAQFLETRKFQVSEIARIFRVPPHMLADLDRATFSNIEHLGIEFVTYTLGPWLVNWEQQIYRSLLSPAERKQLFAEHLTAALLRGDIKSRYDAYATARQNGWLSANDIREIENMNPVDGGDVYLVPLNMIPADQVGQQPAQPAGAAGQRSLPRETIEERGRRSARQRRKLIGVYRGLYEQTTERVLRREIADIKAAAKKYLGKRDMGQFDVWLSEYYDSHLDFIEQAFGPVNDAYGLVVGNEAAGEVGFTDDVRDVLGTFLMGYLITFARRHAGTSVNQVRNALRDALAQEIDLFDAIDQLGQHWLDVRPGETAGEETVRLNNASAKQVYRAGGVGKLQWVSFGENCPYCDNLDGKIVGIDDNFLEADTDFKPDGADRPLRTASNIGHGPAHGGCDCMVAAA